MLLNDAPRQPHCELSLYPSVLSLWNNTVSTVKYFAGRRRTSRNFFTLLATSLASLVRGMGRRLAV